MSYIPFPPVESIAQYYLLGSLEFRWGPNKKEPTIIANKLRNIGLVVDDMEPMMAVAREFLIEDMQDRFDREVDLNGVPWPPRNPQYLKQLNKTGYKGRKILQKDYHLIEAVTDRDSYKVTAKTLSINTRGWPVYWHAHNVGSTVGRGKKLPKREFLGMSEAIAFDLIEAFDDYVEGWLKVIWPKRSTGIPMERGALGRISKRIHASDPSRAASVRDQLKRGV